MVRSDLPRGIQAANLVHASGESSPGDLPAGTYAVVLTVPSEQELRRVAARLKVAGLPFVEVIEPDAPYHGALMAIGLQPQRKEVVRRYLSSLSLLR